MLTLSQPDQVRAREFLKTQARPLEQALYAYYFEHGPRDAALDRLAAFQNPDGGFGRGLEPDLRLADSSVITTTTALHILKSLAVDATHPLIQGTLRFLRATYQPDQQLWPIIPRNTDDAPHAPWWSYDATQTLAWSLDNPRPEIAAYLLRYAPEDLPDGLLESIVARAEEQPDHVETHDNLLCLVHLAETRLLPGTLQIRLMDKVTRMADATVATDPGAWEGYVLTPLKLCSAPDALLADRFADAIAQQIDGVIAQQGEDGAWSPVWSWGPFYPETWPTAAQEWKGILTLQTLRTLRAFKRLAQ